MQYHYATLFDYSPNGTNNSGLAVKSRQLRDALKNGRDVSLNLIQKSIEQSGELLEGFLNPERLLIPAPSSSLTVKHGASVPQLLSSFLVSNGYGSETVDLVTRHLPIRKSSLQTTEKRPTVREHIESLIFRPSLMEGNKFTIIDDVITKGCTTVAVAEIIRTNIESPDIKIFSIMRTRTNDFNNLSNPQSNIIHYYSSGLTYRED